MNETLEKSISKVSRRFCESFYCKEKEPPVMEDGFVTLSFVPFNDITDATIKLQICKKGDFYLRLDCGTHSYMAFAGWTDDSDNDETIQKMVAGIFDFFYNYTTDENIIKLVQWIKCTGPSSNLISALKELLKTF